MATSQLVAYLTDGYGYGWTERYWYDWGSTISLLNNNVQSFVNIRNSILSNDCALNHVRGSSGAYRNPFFWDTNPNPGAPTGKVSGPATADFTRLILRWRGANGYGRTFLGGVPNSMIVGDTFVPTASYLQALNAYLFFFFNNGWKLNSGVASGKPIKIPASGLSPVQPRGYSFLSSTGLFTVGDVIRMHNATVVGYNGTKTVVRVTPGAPNDTVEVGGATPATADVVDNSQFVTKEQLQFISINEGNFEGVTRRSAGRPFGQRRGHRAATVPLRR